MPIQNNPKTEFYAHHPDLTFESELAITSGKGMDYGWMAAGHSALGYAENLDTKLPFPNYNLPTGTEYLDGKWPSKGVYLTIGEDYPFDFHSVFGTVSNLAVVYFVNPYMDGENYWGASYQLDENANRIYNYQWDSPRKTLNDIITANVGTFRQKEPFPQFRWPPTDGDVSNHTQFYSQSTAYQNVENTDEFFTSAILRLEQNYTGSSDYHRLEPYSWHLDFRQEASDLTSFGNVYYNQTITGARATFIPGLDTAGSTDAYCIVPLFDPLGVAQTVSPYNTMLGVFPRDPTNLWAGGTKTPASTFQGIESTGSVFEDYSVMQGHDETVTFLQGRVHEWDAPTANLSYWRFLVLLNRDTDTLENIHPVAYPRYGYSPDTATTAASVGHTWGMPISPQIINNGTTCLMYLLEVGSAGGDPSHVWPYHRAWYVTYPLNDKFNWTWTEYDPSLSWLNKEVVDLNAANNGPYPALFWDFLKANGSYQDARTNPFAGCCRCHWLRDDAGVLHMVAYRYWVTLVEEDTFELYVEAWIKSDVETSPNPETGWVSYDVGTWTLPTIPGYGDTLTQNPYVRRVVMGDPSLSINDGTFIHETSGVPIYIGLTIYIAGNKYINTELRIDWFTEGDPVPSTTHIMKEGVLDDLLEGTNVWEAALGIQGFPWLFNSGNHQLLTTVAQYPNLGSTTSGGKLEYNWVDDQFVFFAKKAGDQNANTQAGHGMTLFYCDWDAGNNRWTAPIQGADWDITSTVVGGITVQAAYPNDWQFGFSKLGAVVMWIELTGESPLEYVYGIAADVNTAPTWYHHTEALGDPVAKLSSNVFASTNDSQGAITKYFGEEFRQMGKDNTRHRVVDHYDLENTPSVFDSTGAAPWPNDHTSMGGFFIGDRDNLDTSGNINGVFVNFIRNNATSVISAMCGGFSDTTGDSQSTPIDGNNPYTPTNEPVIDNTYHHSPSVKDHTVLDGNGRIYGFAAGLGLNVFRISWEVGLVGSTFTLEVETLGSLVTPAHSMANHKANSDWFVGVESRGDVSRYVLLRNDQAANPLNISGFWIDALAPDLAAANWTPIVSGAGSTLCTFPNTDAHWGTMIATAANSTSRPALALVNTDVAGTRSIHAITLEMWGALGQAYLGKMDNNVHTKFVGYATTVRIHGVMSVADQTVFLATPQNGAGQKGKMQDSTIYTFLATGTSGILISPLESDQDYEGPGARTNRIDFQTPTGGTTALQNAFALGEATAGGASVPSAGVSFMHIDHGVGGDQEQDLLDNYINPDRAVSGTGVNGKLPLAQLDDIADLYGLAADITGGLAYVQAISNTSGDFENVAWPEYWRWVFTDQDMTGLRPDLNLGVDTGYAVNITADGPSPTFQSTTADLWAAWDSGLALANMRKGYLNEPSHPTDPGFGPDSDPRIALGTSLVRTPDTFGQNSQERDLEIHVLSFVNVAEPPEEVTVLSDQKYNYTWDTLTPIFETQNERWDTDAFVRGLRDHTAIYSIRVSTQHSADYETRVAAQHEAPIHYSITVQHEAPYGPLIPAVKQHEAPYDTTDPIVKQHESLWELRALNPVTKQHSAVYTMLSGGTSISGAPTITISGLKVDVLEVVISQSDSQVFWDCQMELADHKQISLFETDTAFSVDLLGEVYNFIVTNTQRDRDGVDRPVVRISGTSPGVALDAPRANLITREITTATLASTEVTSLLGAAPAWNITDWTLPAFSLSVERQSPVKIVQQILSASGALLSSEPDGTFRVDYEYPVALPSLINDTPDFTLDDAVDNVRDSQRIELKEDFNKFRVRTSGGESGDVMEYIANEDETTGGILRVYPSPWRVITVTHTDGSVVFLQSQGIQTRQETQVVEFQAGEGQTAYPVNAINNVVWKSTNLGGTSFEADKSNITAPTTVNEGYGLAEITYTVRSYNYRTYAPLGNIIQYLVLSNG